MKRFAIFLADAHHMLLNNGVILGYGYTDDLSKSISYSIRTKENADIIYDDISKGTPVKQIQAYEREDGIFLLIGDYPTGQHCIWHNVEGINL